MTSAVESIGEVVNSIEMKVQASGAVHIAGTIPALFESTLLNPWRRKRIHKAQISPMSQNIDNLEVAAANACTTLTSDVAHVWIFSRRHYLSECEEMSRLISSIENVRAASFRAEGHRRDFIIARALLRVIVGGYCGCHPHEMQFEYGARGKPVLTRKSRRSAHIEFNMSHSGDAVLIAVSQDAEVGADIEEVGSATVYSDAIASTCINAQEAPTFAGLTGMDRSLMLLRYWIHKEAYLKATGCGLSHDAQDLTVTFLDCRRSTIQQTYEPGQQRLFGHDVRCGRNFIGAIVCSARIRTLKYFKI